MIILVMLLMIIILLNVDVDDRNGKKCDSDFQRWFNPLRKTFEYNLTFVFLPNQDIRVSVLIRF